MTQTNQRYPLLEALLRERGLSLKGIYSKPDAAALFNVSVRTIHDWCRAGRLRQRQLPGRGRFLSEDLESFLQNSLVTLNNQDGGE
jgi:transposase